MNGSMEALSDPQTRCWTGAFVMSPIIDGFMEDL